MPSRNPVCKMLWCGKTNRSRQHQVCHTVYFTVYSCACVCVCVRACVWEVCVWGVSVFIYVCVCLCVLLLLWCGTCVAGCLFFVCCLFRFIYVCVCLCVLM